MADDNRWSDRDWRDNDRYAGGRGYYGSRGQASGQGYYGEDDYSSRERWRRMHARPRTEGPAGYNDSGPVQGGWEFGDEAEGGYRGQGYERYGYGRGDPRRSQQTRGEAERYAEPGRGYYDDFEPREQRDDYYGRGRGQGGAYGGYGAAGSYGPNTTTGYGASGAASGQSGYGISAEDGDYRNERYAYGSHTPYGYRGRNEYDARGRGARYARPGRRPDEDRSWLERAGDKVAEFFGAEDEGRHRGRGPRGYRRSDDRIREDVSDRLTDDPWLDASNIDVEVNNCEVILKGEVDSRDDKRRAENLAESISGVRNVQNHLRLEGMDDTDGARRQTTASRTTASTGANATAPKGQQPTQ